MQQIFWLERWQLNQIGFHNADINDHLKKKLAIIGTTRKKSGVCSILWQN